MSRFAPSSVVLTAQSDLMQQLETLTASIESISAGDWAWVGVSIHLLLTVFMVVRILSTQRNTGIAIAWLVLLFAIPFFSIVAYILVGEPYLGKSYKLRNAQAQKMLQGVA